MIMIFNRMKESNIISITSIQKIIHHWIPFHVKRIVHHWISFHVKNQSVDSKKSSAFMHFLFFPNLPLSSRIIPYHPESSRIIPILFHSSIQTIFSRAFLMLSSRPSSSPPQRTFEPGWVQIKSKIDYFLTQVDGGMNTGE